jgi:hypothetical protein
MIKKIWISAPLGIKGDLEALMSFIDSNSPNSRIGDIHFIVNENGDRVSYEFKGQHPETNVNSWMESKEELPESEFDIWRRSSVMGNYDLALNDTFQALDPNIRSSMDFLYDEDFDDEILADYVHQMRKAS